MRLRNAAPLVAILALLAAPAGASDLGSRLAEELCAGADTGGYRQYTLIRNEISEYATGNPSGQYVNVAGNGATQTWRFEKTGSGAPPCSLRREAVVITPGSAQAPQCMEALVDEVDATLTRRNYTWREC